MKIRYLLWTVIMLWLAVAHAHYAIVFGAASIILFILSSRRAARIGREETVSGPGTENYVPYPPQAASYPQPGRRRSRGRR